MKLVDKTIWDYDIEAKNIKNPRILRWFLERKINSGSWENIRAVDLKKYYAGLTIELELKNLLRLYFKHEQHAKKSSQ